MASQASETGLLLTGAPGHLELPTVGQDWSQQPSPHGEGIIGFWKMYCSFTSPLDGNHLEFLFRFTNEPSTGALEGVQVPAFELLHLKLDSTQTRLEWTDMFEYLRFEAKIDLIQGTMTEGVASMNSTGEKHYDFTMQKQSSGTRVFYGSAAPPLAPLSYPPYGDGNMFQVMLQPLRSDLDDTYTLSCFRGGSPPARINVCARPEVNGTTHRTCLFTQVTNKHIATVQNLKAVEMRGDYSKLANQDCHLWFQGYVWHPKHFGEVEVVGVTADAMKPTTISKINVLFGIFLIFSNPLIKLNAAYEFYTNGDIGFAIVSGLAVLATISVMVYFIKTEFDANKERCKGFVDIYANMSLRQWLQETVTNDYRIGQLGPVFAKLKTALAPETQVSMFLIPYGIGISNLEWNFQTGLMVLSILLDAQTAQWQADNLEENFGQPHRRVVISSLSGSTLRLLPQIAGQLCGLSGGGMYPHAIFEASPLQEGDRIFNTATRTNGHVTATTGQDFNVMSDDGVVSETVSNDYIKYISDRDGSVDKWKTYGNWKKVPLRLGGMSLLGVLATPLHSKFESQKLLRWAVLVSFVLGSQCLRFLLFYFADRLAELASGMYGGDSAAIHRRFLASPWHFKRSQSGPYLHIFRLIALLVWQGSLLAIVGLTSPSAAKGLWQYESDTTGLELAFSLSVAQVVAIIILSSVVIFCFSKFLALVCAQTCECYPGLNLASGEWLVPRPLGLNAVSDEWHVPWPVPPLPLPSS